MCRDNAKLPPNPTGKEGKELSRNVDKCAERRLRIKVSSLTEITGAVSVAAALIVVCSDKLAMCDG